MKNFIYLLALLPALGISATITLQESDLPELIESRNGRVAGAGNLLKAGQQQLGHLKRSFLPRFELGVGHEKTDASPASSISNEYDFYEAEAKINLFNGGRDLLTEELRQAGVINAKTQLLDSKFEALTLARSLFWRIIYQKEVIAILESSLKLNENNLQAALKKIRNNLTTRTDEIDFDQTRTQLSQDLLKARILLRNNMRELAAILNHPIDTSYDVPGSIAHEAGHALDEFEGEFVPEKHRDIGSLAALQVMADKESLIEGRWWTPQLDLYGVKRRSINDFTRTSEIELEEGSVLGMKLSFFFDGLESQVDSVADAYRSRAYSLIKNQRERELQMTYQNSYELYQLNHELVHSAEVNNRLAQRYYDNVRNEYSRGVKNSPDVLQAFMRVVEAQLRYAEIKKDYQVARAQLQGLRQE